MTPDLALDLEKRQKALKKIHKHYYIFGLKSLYFTALLVCKAAGRATSIINYNQNQRVPFHNHNEYMIAVFTPGDPRENNRKYKWYVATGHTNK